MADVKPLKISSAGTPARFVDGDTIPVSHGGTGVSTLTALTANILPSQTGNGGKMLSTDGAGTLSWVTGGQGAIGYTGSAGAVGYTGSAGVDGAVGYTGSAGVAGYTGSIGYTGSTSYTVVSDTAPASPFNGKLWFDSTTARMKIWYDDGISAQWVDAAVSPVGYTGSAGSNGSVGYTGSAGTAGTQVRYLSQPGDLVTITGKARWYPPQGLTLTWIEASVNTPSVGANIQLALKMNGITVSGAVVTINAGSNRSTRYNISQAVTTDDYISLDVTQIGTVTPGSDLSVTVAFTYN